MLVRAMLLLSVRVMCYEILWGEAAFFYFIAGM